MSKQAKGIIAAGHELTTEAGAEALRLGGNVYDAIIASFFSACVVEPVLASLAGGGFLLAQPARHSAVVYDFFAQTPQRRFDNTGDVDFHPIHADFGTTTQEFHIGMGSVATPGCVAGMFSIHRDLGSLPLKDILAPAIHYARNGIKVNRFQAYISGIIKPIYLYSSDARNLFESREKPGNMLQENELLVQAELADILEALVLEGERLFYEGEISQAISALSESRGGHIRRRDLESYSVIKRAPLRSRYRHVDILTNPPPSSGGALVVFAKQLWSHIAPTQPAFGGIEHLLPLTQVLEVTGQARLEAELKRGDDATHLLSLLDEQALKHYRKQVLHRTRSHRGTTHISAMDTKGNAASLTVSNGEGCGHLIPGTGIMLNNMLGEEDINPEGFHNWREDERMTSMMAPSILSLGKQTRIAMGSGGSNRIRTALLQVMINVFDFGFSLQKAVDLPRIHVENGKLNMEHGFQDPVINKLKALYSDARIWPDTNLYFGGVHAIQSHNNRFEGAGDPRRGGHVRVVI